LQNARGQKRAEKDYSLEAKRCRCGAWFTIKGRRDRDRCFRCEERLQGAQEGPPA